MLSRVPAHCPFTSFKRQLHPSLNYTTWETGTAIMLNLFIQTGHNLHAHLRPDIGRRPLSQSRRRGQVHARPEKAQSFKGALTLKIISCTQADVDWPRTTWQLVLPACICALEDFTAPCNPAAAGLQDMFFELHLAVMTPCPHMRGITILEVVKMPVLKWIQIACSM